MTPFRLPALLAPLAGLLLAACQTAPSPSASEPPAQAPEAKPAETAAGSPDPLDRSRRPPPGPPPESFFPEHAERQLDNGLKVYVVESDRQPTVSFRLLLRSGGLFDGDKPGLAATVAGLLDKGAGGRSAYAIAREIDFIGGRLSSEATSDFLVASAFGLERHADALAGLLADIVRRPDFPEMELAKLKRRQLSDLASERKDPDALAGKLRRRLVYGEAGYGAFETEESLAAIGLEDVRSFHGAHFRPNNASLAVVGALSVEEAAALAREHFGDWEAAPAPELPAFDFPEETGRSVHIVHRPESAQASLRVAQPGPPRAHPDTPELRALISVLGGGFSGRLFQNLREDKGYTYGASAFAAHAKLAGAIVCSTATRPAVAAAAAAEIYRELERLRAAPVPQTELEMHKRYLVGNYMLSLEDPAVIARRLQNIDLYGLPADYYETYAERILQVTPELALELAREHIRPDAAAVAAVGDAEAIAEDLAALGEVALYNARLEPLEAPPAPGEAAPPPEGP